METLIAIDASLTNTAVCLYQRDGTYQMKCFGSKPAPGLARFWRYRELVSSIEQFVPSDARVFLEGYAFGARGAAILSIAEFGGMLRDVLIDRLCGLTEVPPTVVKLFAAQKGNADKRAMAVAAVKRWGVEFPTDDEVDAFALAKLGACVLGWEQPENDAQRRAVDTVLGVPVKTKKKRKAS